MTTVRIVITLKPGVLDAQGQAVQLGLSALGYDSITSVRVGKCIELVVPDEMTREDVNAMCERFLANPLIEEWRIETQWTGDQGPGTRSQLSRSPVPTLQRSREAR